MRPALRQASHILHQEHALPRSVPLFLCPALLREPYIAVHRQLKQQSSKSFSTFPRCRHEALAHPAQSPEHAERRKTSHSTSKPIRSIPLSCPGCGAPSQRLQKDDAGYYNLDRKAVKAYLEYDPSKVLEERREDNVYTRVLQQADPSILEEAGLNREILGSVPTVDTPVPQTPVCERCHNLLNHRVGTPIYHPTLESIRETIAESPHKRNHIYHVVDAVDFPLSLVPGLQAALKLPKLRTHNRRARHGGWMSGDRVAEVSFIITRSDLLAPMKEQVDKLMPYMQTVLRQALGRAGRNLRLGNVHMVSSKRGWWTKDVKEAIWERGGAGFMVGKVNVGKSALFEAVFPKRRMGKDNMKSRSQKEKEQMLSSASSLQELIKIQERLANEDAAVARAQRRAEKHDSLAALRDKADQEEREEEEQEEPDFYDENSLLPPPQPYSLFPTLPVATSLPGTTASPIRVLFGEKKGELIDLPGLARTNPELSTFVKAEHHSDLVMQKRVSAERHVLKPGQSLVLGGGLIRITPTHPEDTIFLAHPFVPIEPHVSSTEKAATLQEQTRESGVPSIILPGAGKDMRSAGRFPLKWDVTKRLAGPLTRKEAGKMKPENLPFAIYAADVLVEGVGWVEVSCQVRKGKNWKPPHLTKESEDHEHGFGEESGEREVVEVEEADVKEESRPDALEKAGFADSVRCVRDSSEFPEIEVFSPLGKFIGIRQPMCGSMLGGPKQVGKRSRKVRPRMSMVAVKARRKPVDRAAGAV